MKTHRLGPWRFANKTCGIFFFAIFLQLFLLAFLTTYKTTCLAYRQRLVHFENLFFTCKNIFFVNGLCCIQPQFQAALLFTQLENFVSNVRNPLKNGLMLDFISSLWNAFCYTKDQTRNSAKKQSFCKHKIRC